MSRLLIYGGTPRPLPGVPSPPRLEITTFVQPANIKQYSLYIQALDQYFRKPTADRASYYQISGIHGRPHVNWDGAPGGTANDYCVHGSTVFASWHRPYVVLFEQEIQRLALGIAQNYAGLPDGAQWKKAAEDLRQPYWGWDAHATFIPPPEVIRLTNVNIIQSDGRQHSVPNPFLAYPFRAGETSTFSTRFQTARTLRHPLNGVSQPDRLVQALRAVENDVVYDSARLYSLTTWAAFTQGTNSTNGLEDIHNTIHIQTGGAPAGHMTAVEAAGFDPIFWLHHSQVDRVIDIWYAIHRKWETSTSDLLPFWRTQTTFWKSPGIEHTDATFNYLYRPAITTRSEDASAQSEEASVLASAPLTAPEQTPIERGVALQEWGVYVRCKKFEVGGSFSVYVFFGEVPSKVENWISDPTFVGVFDVFANNAPDECPNCTEQRDALIYGIVHITHSLTDKGKLPSVEKPDDVLKYLGSKLRWGVLGALDGKPVKIENFPSLEVTVESTPLTYPVGGNYPFEGKTKVHKEVTSHLPGGYKGKYEY